MTTDPHVAVLMSYLSADQTSCERIGAAADSLRYQPDVDITLCVRCVGEPVNLPRPTERYSVRTTQTDGTETWGASHNATMRDLYRHGIEPDYYAILNADDEYLPGGLSALVEALQSHPDAVLAYGDYQAVDGEAVSTDNVTPFEQLNLSQAFGLGPFLCWSLPVAFDETLTITADWEMALRLSTFGPLVRVATQVGRFLVRPDSLSHADRGTLRAEQERVRARARCLL